MVLKVSLNTGINRIRLEFKEVKERLSEKGVHSINRIRLEFKADNKSLRPLRTLSINRIRLEFKAVRLDTSVRSAVPY